jgi:hypothetical protein
MAVYALSDSSGLSVADPKYLPLAWASWFSVDAADAGTADAGTTATVTAAVTANARRARGRDDTVLLLFARAPRD